MTKKMNAAETVERREVQLAKIRKIEVRRAFLQNKLGMPMSRFTEPPAAPPKTPVGRQSLSQSAPAAPHSSGASASGYES